MQDKTLPQESIIPDETVLPFGMHFIDPAKIISQLEVGSGMKIAHFGSGTGFFSIATAKLAGENGEVHALDILKPKLESVESQAKLLGLTNIITKRVNLEAEGGSKLPDASMDWVFLVNMLFQNKNKEIIFVEAKRVLKDGGSILVIEWNEKDSSVGPAQEVKVSREALAQIIEKVGLGIVKDVEVSNFHYGMLLRK